MNHTLRSLAKLEHFDPAGSVKGCIAKAMIDVAEATGGRDLSTPLFAD